jgi:DNA-directed RNA polymerase subunit L
MRWQLPGSTPTAASFEFLNEGHTLGNALRYIIMKKYVLALSQLVVK